VQARIDGVQDGPGAGCGVIQFEVAIAVPGQRGDPVGHPDAATAQGIGQAPAAGRQLPVGGPVDVALDPARDDFLLAVVAFGVLQQRRNQQWHLHHGPEHGVSSERELDAADNTPQRAGSHPAKLAMGCFPTELSSHQV
jgi:hypothetical protein